MRVLSTFVDADINISNEVVALLEETLSNMEYKPNGLDRILKIDEYVDQMQIHLWEQAFVEDTHSKPTGVHNGRTIWDLQCQISCLLQVLQVCLHPTKGRAKDSWFLCYLLVLEQCKLHDHGHNCSQVIINKIAANLLGTRLERSFVEISMYLFTSARVF